MKKSLFRVAVLVFLAFSVQAQGANEKIPELKLKDGRTYQQVTITKKTPDGIAIMTQDGTARIPYENLPEDLVKKLGGFDAEKAKEYRDAQAKNEAKYNAELDKAPQPSTVKQPTPKEGKPAAPQAAKDEDNKPKSEVDNDDPKNALVQCVSKVEGGCICQISWEMTTTMKVLQGRQYVTVPEKYMTGLSVQEFYIAGLDLVDDEIAQVVIGKRLPNYESGSEGYKKTLKAYEFISFKKKK